MAQEKNLIPVFQEYLGDTETPVSAYLKIRDRSFSYLLESAERDNSWGRYSFIGYKPFLTILSHNGGVEINRGNQGRIFRDIPNPLDILKQLNREYRPMVADDLPPFQGGLVGFFSYDLFKKWEHLPGIPLEDPESPECIFTACRRLIVFDHMTHQIKAVVFAHIHEGTNLEHAYGQACREVEEIIGALRRPFSSMSEEDQISLSNLESNYTREDFEKAVCKVKEHIVSGDAIQVVISQRFSSRFVGDDFFLYRNLRSINPSPYMFYLNFGSVKLLGSSPEVLVRLNNNKIDLRPIAGTRGRGKTPEEDQKLEYELMEDPKECAEHIMLVDLGRNDVGKVAVPGSVTVPRLMEVERYSHVMHLVSHVEGQLSPHADEFDLFMGAFPAGTVTGAPKIRAMEIISELEPSSRGPYAGAVGYFGFNGNMDFCITIRTISVVKDRLAIQVGAGIVADSSPKMEYEETMRKAAGIFEAIERAKRR
jgi:anthranilate synthase component 1